MSSNGYAQFCPVAMAAEILCTRWTVLIVRELLMGTTRFNDLRRGAPRVSPALLSQRLKELEAAGVVARLPVAREPGIFEYHLTSAGQELRPIVESIGIWGHRWVESEVSLKHLDAQLLMWDMRRRLDPEPLPARRVTIHFQYPEQAPKHRAYWLVVTPDQGVDLCSVDPGFDVDLYVTSDLRTMTAIWMGMDTVRAARASDRLALVGDRQLAADMERWLGLSSFAGVERLAG